MCYFLIKSKIHLSKLGTVVHACNFRTWAEEAGESEAQGQPQPDHYLWLQSDKASLRETRITGHPASETKYTVSCFTSHQSQCTKLLLLNRAGGIPRAEKGTW